MKVGELLKYILAEELIGKHAVANYSDQWERGVILEIDSETTKLALSELDTEVDLPNNKVIPFLRQTMIKHVLKSRNIAHNLDLKIRNMR